MKTLKKEMYELCEELFPLNRSLTGKDVVKTLNIIKELMNSDVEFVTDKQRVRPSKSEVFRLWCDNTKIEKLTEFKPQVDIREGLQRTINWIIDRFSQY